MDTHTVETNRLIEKSAAGMLWQYDRNTEQPTWQIEVFARAKAAEIGGAVVEISYAMGHGRYEVFASREMAVEYLDTWAPHGTRRSAGYVDLTPPGLGYQESYIRVLPCSDHAQPR